MDTIVSKQFYQEIFEVLQEAKTYASKAINFASVLANWHTGRLIVEEEQKGMERAKYGKFLIKELSERLREDFGRGYDPTNLKLFRKFYLEFPIWTLKNQKGDTLSHLLPDFKLLQKKDPDFEQLQTKTKGKLPVYSLKIGTKLESL